MSCLLYFTSKMNVYLLEQWVIVNLASVCLFGGIRDMA